MLNNDFNNKSNQSQENSAQSSLDSDSILLKSLSKDKGDSFVITPAKSCLIGRDELCDIIIDNPKLSKKHARIFYTDQGYTLEDLNSTNGTFINDKIIASVTILKPGDIIQFGEESLIRFIIQTKLHKTRSYNLDTLSYATLTLINSKRDTANQYVLPMDKSLFAGRSKRVKICLEDKSISAVHCKFFGENNLWYIQGMGDKSQVYVNDNPINAIHPLQENDIVKIGSSQILFNIKNTAVAMPSINLEPRDTPDLGSMNKTGDWAIKALNLPENFDETHVNSQYSKLMDECRKNLETSNNDRLKQWYSQRIVFLKDAKEQLQKEIQQSKTLMLDGSDPMDVSNEFLNANNALQNSPKSKTQKNNFFHTFAVILIKLLLLIFIIWLLWEILAADSYYKAKASNMVSKTLKTVELYEKQNKIEHAVKEINKINLNLLDEYPELKRQVKNKKYQLTIKSELKQPE